MGTSTTAPKDVVREMAQNQLITDVKTWLESIDMRDLSSHTYNEELAEQVYAFAVRFLPEEIKIQMNHFALTEDEFELLQDIVIRPLAKAGAKVWCFGSRAKGTHSKYSDIDLMVESSQSLTLLIGEVHEAIVGSSFPYKVDIVDLQYFAQEYRANFEAEKRLISD